MNLAFTYQNPVNYFKVIGSVSPQDLKVIRAALFRFFESSPGYVVLNFSEAKNLETIPSTELHQVLTEIQSFASASKVFFRTVHTELETIQVAHSILEEAICQKSALLSSKNALKEDLKNKAQVLLSENEELKKTLNAIPVPSETGSLTSLLDRFWSTSK